MNNLYHIHDKNGQLVPFRMNIFQEFLLYVYEKSKVDVHFIRDFIILKGRQIGITTFNVLYNLDEAIFTEGYRYALIAQGREEMREMFDKIKVAWENLEYRGGASVVSDTGSRMKFAHGSLLKVTLSARGDTLNSLTVSELAKIGNKAPKKEKEIKTGAFNAVSSNGIKVIEGTGEGTRGLFYEMCKKAEKKENDYMFIFFPWWQSEEYELPMPEGTELLSITLEQRELAQVQYGVYLSDAKLYWWQKKYEEHGEDAFQEYPTIARQAFLATGRPFYNAKNVDKIITKKGFTDEKYSTLTWYLDEKYKDITLRKSYLEDQWNLLIGIDFAEGLEHGDYTVMRIRTRDGKLIASFRDHIEPDEMCVVLDYVYSLGLAATIGPERNNHGHAFLAVAKSHSWHEDVFMDKSIDTVSQKPKNKLGWHTNAVTRPLMLDEHNEAVRKGLIEVDDELKEEMGTFFYVKGKPQAIEPNHDDIIIADSICWQMRKEQKIKGFI